MSNSSLVSYTKLCSNHSGNRTHSIDRITPHCVVGQLSAEGIAACFPKAVYNSRGELIAGREASCNYGIGKDGRIALIVEEKYRSWCSSSESNDQRAVTIECASDTTHPYTMTNAVYESLINLCVDICKRNGKNKLIWFGNKNKTLNYKPAYNEMVLTVHRWFANKPCPGDWLYSRLGDLANQVTARLSTTPAQHTTSGLLYRVQVGAYKSKGNAEKQLQAVKSKGFDAFITEAGGLYKIQVGAYSQKSNADAQLVRVKAAGFDAFITTNGGSAVSSAPTIKVGSNVKVRSGAKTYNGVSLASFVYSRVHQVSQINGDRAVISYNGTVVAAVHLSDLTIA